MTVQNVRHSEFVERLAQRVKRAGTSELEIALCIAGGAQERNIVITQPGRPVQHWLVGLRGGTTRSDHWNVYGWMVKALLGREAGEFQDEIQEVFEDGINRRRTGYVVLTVKGARPASAVWRKTL